MTKPRACSDDAAPDRRSGPRSASRSLWWFALHVALPLFRVVWRFSVRGEIPSTGAILAPNHVSYLDSWILAAAARRPITFLIVRSDYERPVLGRFVRAFGALPIAPEDGPRRIARTLELAAERARQGELVAVFPEGSLTRTGFTNGFQRGLEIVARRSGAPIVPVYHHGAWDSAFSHAPGPRWKRALRRGGPIEAVIGVPLDPRTRVAEIERAVRELAAQAAERRNRAGPNLARLFLAASRRTPAALAVADSTGARLGYFRLALASLALARLLARRARGEARIGVLLPPGAGGTIANLAIALGDRSSVNLNYTLSNAELAELCERAGVRTLLTAQRFLRALGRSSPLPAERTLALEELTAELGPGARLRAMLDWLAPALGRFARAPAEVELCVLFSSGTTAKPKGVVLTHANVAANVEALTAGIQLERRDRLLGVLPFFHAFGYGVTLWAPLVHGAALVALADPLDARGVAELSRTHGVTILLATPAFYHAWMRRVERVDFASVRLAVTGASHLPQSLAEVWRERYGFELHEGYGCTELSPVVSVNVPDWRRGDHVEIGRRAGTVGRALPDIALDVVDPDSGERCTGGASGLLLVRSAGAMRGYLDDPDATARAFRGRWYVTGDVASIDADGFVTLVDRLARFSKVGGEMVSHQRVAEALLSALRDRASNGAAPVELAATTLPDPGKGERLAIVHTPLPVDLDQLYRSLVGGTLPRLWLPHRDAFVAVDELPKLATGKPDLRRIREIAAARLAR